MPSEICLSLKTLLIRKGEAGKPASPHFLLDDKAVRDLGLKPGN